MSYDTSYYSTARVTGSHPNILQGGYKTKLIPSKYYNNNNNNNSIINLLFHHLRLH